MQKTIPEHIPNLLNTEKDDCLISYKNLDFFKSDIRRDKLCSLVKTGTGGIIPALLNSLNTEKVFELSNRKNR